MKSFVSVTVAFPLASVPEAASSTSPLVKPMVPTGVPNPKSEMKRPPTVASTLKLRVPSAAAPKKEQASKAQIESQPSPASVSPSSQILFGPSEKAVDFNTREVVGKGLAFLGANRSFVPHFQWVMERLVGCEVQRLLGAIVSSTSFAVRSADDLNNALYGAWTKKEPHKSLISWPGLE
jgi:hypothetical protein